MDISCCWNWVVAGMRALLDTVAYSTAIICGLELGQDVEDVVDYRPEEREHGGRRKMLTGLRDGTYTFVSWV